MAEQSRFHKGQAMDLSLKVANDPQESCCDPAPLARRELLKIAGAAAPILAAPMRVMAGPFSEASGDVQHFVPADKKLDEAWVRSLFTRGEPEIYRGRQLATVGMPIGGITCGQIYLLGDGTLGLWDIFNQHRFTGFGSDSWEYEEPTRPVDHGFTVHVKQGGKQHDHQLNIEDVPDVEFRGEYPIGYVTYPAGGFPVEVQLEAFSPFIPLNTRESATPATVFHFTVENTSDETIDVHMSGALENPVCFHNALNADGLRRTRIVKGDSRGMIVHTAEDAPAGPPRPPRPPILIADFEGDDYGNWKTEGKAFGSGPAKGTLPTQNPVSGYKGKGLVNSFLGGDDPTGALTSPEFTLEREYLNFLIGGGKHAGETAIELLIDGEVVRTATGRNEEQLKPHAWRVKKYEGRAARLRIIDKTSGGWGHINVDHIEMADEPATGAPTSLVDLFDFGSMVLAHDGATTSDERDERFPLENRRTAYMHTEPVRIAPGQKNTFTFVLAWYFPNHANGHAYNNWFTSAAEVADFVLDDIDRLTRETRDWHDAFYDSTLPYYLLNRIGSTVANLATNTVQWWANGRFWAWEGVGCCHGTCTHVWNYAHALARLFPDLERSAREMQDLDVALHGDGLVGFRGERNGHYAADGQAGTVLKCYREHLCSPDDAFLKRNWPNIRKVIGYSIGQDGDDDGLITNSQHNTFDINFFGPNTFVGSLYLAALRAAEEMARRVGDTAYADRLNAIFTSGSKLSDEKLWQDDYYVQRVDLAQHPKHQYGEGCLSDQVFGQNWAHQLGLGHIYRPDRVKQALESVWTYNWAPDVTAHNKAHKPERWFISPGQAGLFTCTWPRSKHLAEGVRYQNEVWTGIEYQVAAGMIWEGLLTEALTIIRAIHDRYDPARNNPWNEVECGDHYARSLASWGCLTALSGFTYDGPAGRIGFAPRMTPEDFRCVFTASQGWGTFAQQRQATAQSNQLTLRYGTLLVNAMTLLAPKKLAGKAPSLSLDNEPFDDFTADWTDAGELRLTMKHPIVLQKGQTLSVRIAT